MRKPKYLILPHGSKNAENLAKNIKYLKIKLLFYLYF